MAEESVYSKDFKYRERKLVKYRPLISSLWRNGLILQFVLLITFLVTSSVLGAEYREVHIIIFFLVIGMFFITMLIAIIAAINIQRSVFFALFILILFNGFGSLLLYFIYRREMKEITD